MIRPDEDLQGVLDFLTRILPELEEIEERLPPETVAVTLEPDNAFLRAGALVERGRRRLAPVAVKDVIDVAGMPTTAASKMLHRVPDRDAECVARLRAAGATSSGS